ncbi:CPBP family intramembrane glutamic endopeptidase [Brevibacterium litoralis]|uniref:CPBP family intramembrane glutamic endopeptidase n=1 Tax=Brevibacterium litoralis TaxID=3138935 RepID=UPI0032EFAC7D
MLVAALSLGQSAVYAAVNLLEISTRAPIAQAQANLNTSQSARPWFDLLYQLLGLGFSLVPVVLALYLMSRDQIWPALGVEVGDTRPVALRTGLDLYRPWSDTGRGLLLFLVIGIGTLGVYWAGRGLGITAEIVTNNLSAHWWTVPVLLLAAAKNGILEEVLLLAFGADRLEKLRWNPWTIILVLALFRGAYHLYQGIGPFVGNVLMGLLFGFLYLRWRRTMPFVVAHTVIDAVGFLGPGILAAVDPRV